MENLNLRFWKVAVRISSNSVAVLCVLIALLTLHRKMKVDGRLLNSCKLCPRLSKVIVHLVYGQESDNPSTIMQNPSPGKIIMWEVV